MDFRLIINSIIIIFFLHIIILNINYNIVIGKKKVEKIENFNSVNSVNSVKSDISDNSDNSDSMKFLTNNNNNEDFKKKMLKYINQETPVINVPNPDKLNIEPSNTFLNNNNEPNFESNVADISKFYKINYDNLNQDKTTQSTSIESLNSTNETLPSKREPTVNPDNWSYKNELPMNGGNMNGIIGFDSLESQFAIFNPNKLNLQTSNSDNYNNIPHNDLRKPVVYEN